MHFFLRRETDPIRHREPGDRDPDPASDQYPGAMYAQSAVQLHQTQAHSACRIRLPGERQLDITGFLSWDSSKCHVDLEEELSALTQQAPQGEEARHGERLIQYATENLVTEILIQPQTNTLVQCMRNLLSSFTRHRHIVHAGYAFQGNGSWILQDGTFSLSDFSEAFQDGDVQRVLRAYPDTVSVDLHCASAGGWSSLSDKPFAKGCQLRVNPNDVLTSGSAKINAFIDYLSPMLIPTELHTLLESSDVVGNIRFSHPTLYVFPGGQGDAALFGINGFNMLVDGGFARKACFWDFARHLDRLDAVLMTRLNNSNALGLSSVINRKKSALVYPQIGHFFCNLQDKKSPQSPDGDKDRDPLMLDLLEQGQNILTDLKCLNLKPQACYKDSEPINLYHKVGHGTLDMYVLSPSKDSKEVREFLSKWNNNDSKLFAPKKDAKEFSFPIQNLISICALLVWKPANPADNITRILFPGSTPEHKIFEGLDKIKHLEFMKYPVCSAKSLSPAGSIIGLAKQKIKSAAPLIDKIIPEAPLKSKLIEKDNKIADDIKKSENDIDANKQLDASSPAEVKEEIKLHKISNMNSKPKPIKKPEAKKIELTKVNDADKVNESDKVTSKKDNKDETDTKQPKPKPKIEHKSKIDTKAAPKPRTETKTAKSIDRKPLAPKVEKKPEPVKSTPTTPKKTVENGKPVLNGVAKDKEIAKTKPAPRVPSKVTSTAPPAKSAKEANNRKVVESKIKSTKKEPVEKKPIEKKEAVKVERKPISRRPKAASPSSVIKTTGSPAKSAKSTPSASVKSDKDGVIAPGKQEKESTTESSPVSTPSVDQETTRKLVQGLSAVPLDEAKLQELEDLKEEQEVVREIEAVFQRDNDAEAKIDHSDAEISKVTDDSKVNTTDVEEDEEYIIIEKEEIEQFTEDSINEQESLTKEEEIQKHQRDSEESEKKRRESLENASEDVKQDDDVKDTVEDTEQLTVEEQIDKDSLAEPVVETKVVEDTLPEKEVLKDLPSASPEAKHVDAAEPEVVPVEPKDIEVPKDDHEQAVVVEEPAKEQISVSPDDKLDITSSKKIDDKEESKLTEDLQPEEIQKEHLQESQPDEKISTTIESGATTAPTLPEDERIPLDEIKEDQVIEEKYIKEETKEVEAVPSTLPTNLEPLEDKGDVQVFPHNGHLRDVVKTPDEVADLPMHEEVDYGMYDDFPGSKKKKDEGVHEDKPLKRRYSDEKDKDEAEQEKLDQVDDKLDNTVEVKSNDAVKPIETIVDKDNTAVVEEVEAPKDVTTDQFIPDEFNKTLDGTSVDQKVDGFKVPDMSSPVDQKPIDGTLVDQNVAGFKIPDMSSPLDDIVDISRLPDMSSPVDEVIDAPKSTIVLESQPETKVDAAKIPDMSSPIDEIIEAPKSTAPLDVQPEVKEDVVTGLPKVPDMSSPIDEIIEAPKSAASLDAQPEVKLDEITGLPKVPDMSSPIDEIIEAPKSAAPLDAQPEVKVDGITGLPKVPDMSSPVDEVIDAPKSTVVLESQPETKVGAAKIPDMSSPIDEIIEAPKTAAPLDAQPDVKVDEVTGLPKVPDMSSPIDEVIEAPKTAAALDTKPTDVSEVVEAPKIPDMSSPVDEIIEATKATLSSDTKVDQEAPDTKVNQEAEQKDQDKLEDKFDKDDLKEPGLLEQVKDEIKTETEQSKEKPADILEAVDDKAKVSEPETTIEAADTKEEAPQKPFEAVCELPVADLSKALVSDEPVEDKITDDKAQPLLPSDKLEETQTKIDSVTDKIESLEKDTKDEIQDFVSKVDDMKDDIQKLELEAGDKFEGTQVLDTKVDDIVEKLEESTIKDEPKNDVQKDKIDEHEVKDLAGKEQSLEPEAKHDDSKDQKQEVTPKDAIVPEISKDDKEVEFDQKHDVTQDATKDNLPESIKLEDKIDQLDEKKDEVTGKLPEILPETKTTDEATKESLDSIPESKPSDLAMKEDLQKEDIVQKDEIKDIPTTDEHGIEDDKLKSDVMAQTFDDKPAEEIKDSQKESLQKEAAPIDTVTKEDKLDIDAPQKLDTGKKVLPDMSSPKDDFVSDMESQIVKDLDEVKLAEIPSQEKTSVTIDDKKPSLDNLVSGLDETTIPEVSTPTTTPVKEDKSSEEMAKEVGVEIEKKLDELASLSESDDHKLNLIKSEPKDVDDHTKPTEDKPLQNGDVKISDEPVVSKHEILEEVIIVKKIKELGPELDMKDEAIKDEKSADVIDKPEDVPVDFGKQEFKDHGITLPDLKDPLLIESMVDDLSKNDISEDLTRSVEDLKDDVMDIVNDLAKDAEQTVEQIEESAMEKLQSVSESYKDNIEKFDSSLNEKLDKSDKLMQEIVEKCDFTSKAPLDFQPFEVKSYTTELRETHITTLDSPIQNNKVIVEISEQIEKMPASHITGSFLDNERKFYVADDKNQYPDFDGESDKNNVVLDPVQRTSSPFVIKSEEEVIKIVANVAEVLKSDKLLEEIIPDVDKKFASPFGSPSVSREKTPEPDAKVQSSTVPDTFDFAKEDEVDFFEKSSSIKDDGVIKKSEKAPMTTSDEKIKTDDASKDLDDKLQSDSAKPSQAEDKELDVIKVDSRSTSGKTTPDIKIDEDKTNEDLVETKSLSGKSTPDLKIDTSHDFGIKVDGKQSPTQLSPPREILCENISGRSTPDIKVTYDETEIEKDEPVGKESSGRSSPVKSGRSTPEIKISDYEDDKKFDSAALSKICEDDDKVGDDKSGKSTPDVLDKHTEDPKSSDMDQLECKLDDTKGGKITPPTAPLSPAIKDDTKPASEEIKSDLHMDQSQPEKDASGKSSPVLIASTHGSSENITKSATSSLEHSSTTGIPTPDMSSSPKPTSPFPKGLASSKDEIVLSGKSTPELGQHLDKPSSGKSSPKPDDVSDEEKFTSPLSASREDLKATGQQVIVTEVIKTTIITDEPKQTDISLSDSNDDKLYSDDEIPESPASISSQIAHSQDSFRYEGAMIDTRKHLDSSDEYDAAKFSPKMDPMSTSFYGELPTTTVKTEPIAITTTKRTETDILEPGHRFLEEADMEFEKALEEHRHLRGTELMSAITSKYEFSPSGFASPGAEGFLNGKLLDEASAEFKLKDVTTKPKDSTESNGFLPEHQADSGEEEVPKDFDPLSAWGKPLGLPSPAPPPTVDSNMKTTPKKEKKNITAKIKLINEKNLSKDIRRRSESPHKGGKKINPVYIDLSYVPHHGNSYYCHVDFFKRVRARYYVFSGTEPSKDVYNALLEAKQTWEDKDLEVTIIPTYDTDVLGYWVSENEDLLVKNRIDLSPSASRCTINLQDHETSCSAYRLEF
ncbi:LOW QUALITY PROTEIN: microtubule-associated protein futsch-like [Ctenocephalides felis]|uniref:LOW QUALITY PROTEIN: microtubule-associated protein futsch-like n=1 Tax=Ctenocephalides felis TaxID=7515 RepID=UPI000E6E59C0|nr:LOW QUALITY PROTEIN: microtubule-associated protein futsch-like [Ctenocephalides felis]